METNNEREIKLFAKRKLNFCNFRKSSVLNSASDLFVSEMCFSLCTPNVETLSNEALTSDSGCGSLKTPAIYPPLQNF